MKAITTLQKQASAIYRPLGHRMKWGPLYGNATSGIMSVNGRCRQCGAAVYIHQANRTPIDGEALKVKCQ
jgi:hypothetical protein